MKAVIDLSAGDLALAALLVIMAGTVSLVLRLGLERRLLVASLRSVLQLLLLGYLLRYIFALDRAWAVCALALLMVSVAAHAAVGRISRRFRGILGTAFLSLVLSSILTSLVVTRVIIGVEPWFRPQYFVPILGMILGNSMNGISLCLDDLLERLSERRDEVEMRLAHGATRWEAARDALAAAVRRGMIPILNAMMIVGVVSLPGMMTGQILAGADPLTAVKYQILVMFMLAAATALGSMLSALAVYRSIFTPRHQLRYEAITRPRRRN